jgi:hypothetical protein
MATVAAPIHTRTDDEVLQLPEMGQWALAWRRLRRHRLGLLGLVMLLLILGMSYGAPLIAP